MIPTDTPYKIIRYLLRLSTEKVLVKNYVNDKFIVHLMDRGYILESNNSENKFATTERFKEIISKEIYDAFQKYDFFIKQHQIENVESYCSISDLDNLILIDNEKPDNLSLQEILAKYFKSSKHTHTNSNLANAIKVILNKDDFAEDNKDQQFISILYPKTETRFIILCENKNRLRKTRHDFIEFWYAGGKNTSQLQFIPNPKKPIFVLCDWDFDGLNTYIHIRKHYFPKLTAFVPTNHSSLMVRQDEVTNHRSKWKNGSFLQYLNERERIIVMDLIRTDSIIEEQRILLTEENLILNSIN